MKKETKKTIDHQKQIFRHQKTHTQKKRKKRRNRFNIGVCVYRI